MFCSFAAVTLKVFTSYKKEMEMDRYFKISMVLLDILIRFSLFCNQLLHGKPCHDSEKTEVLRSFTKYQVRISFHYQFFTVILTFWKCAIEYKTGPIIVQF